jgi:hypothetical protein
MVLSLRAQGAHLRARASHIGSKAETAWEIPLSTVAGTNPPTQLSLRDRIDVPDTIQDQTPSHRPPTGLFGATRVGELKVGRSSYLISCGLLVGKEPDLDPGPAEWVEHTKDPRVWRRGAAWSRTGPFSADPGASARCEPSAASKFAVPSKGDRWVPWIRTLILRRFRPTTRAGWCFPGCNLELWV